MTFVRICCTTPVWDPYQQNLIATLERVQKMTLRMCWSASYEDLLLQFNLPTLFSLFGLTWLYILPPWTLDWEAMILHILLAWCLVPQLIIHCFSPMLFKCGMTSLPLELRHYQFSRKRSSTTGTLMTVNYNYYLYILVLAGMLLIRPCI